ncbi:DNA-processing protein DprA [uncultured Halomonas sp.]|uniref:DNA-processing protein DprA n=1 Tax=uncultured Halomonas sp. TaxID=173971 RepID=UPI0026106501|nr:DNA-processing protein DprA [uncultured Halomonas sp.]
MTLSTAAQATLLLTSYFSKPAGGAARPLTPTEWGEFAQWLHEQGHTPVALLEQERGEILNGWSHPKITRERLEALLQRGSSMALAMEKWQRSGLWVITRSDPEYPRRLKKRLKHTAPPVLFGCGNAELLNVGGLAVVGSRKAGDQDLAYAHGLGAKATQAGIGIVSGGARGVDEAAMQGAIQEGGPVIGVLSEGLLKAATSSKWRQGLMSGGLVLVSPYFPEASFNTGNAMGRNKYIYCLADAALVVHSGASGGTKSGAEENLKKGWVPLWVKPTQDSEAGNQALVDAGGIWCEEDIEQLDIPSLSAIATQPVEKGAKHLASPLIQEGVSDPEEAEAENFPGRIDQPEGEDTAIAQTQPGSSADETDSPISLGDAKDEGHQENALEPSGTPQPDLFGEDTVNADVSGEAPQTNAEVVVESEPYNEDPDAPSQPRSEQVASSKRGNKDVSPVEGIDFYRLFLAELQRLAQTPKSADEIITATGLQKTQVNTWLKRAVEDGRLEKRTRPVRYKAIAEDAQEAEVAEHVVRLTQSFRSLHSFESS